MSELSARILIVDDEAPLVTALCDTLNNRGYESVGFSSPKEALSAAQATKFELLLVDLMMPEMSGIDLLQAAQTSKSCSGMSRKQSRCIAPTSWISTRVAARQLIPTIPLLRLLPSSVSAAPTGLTATTKTTQLGS